MTQRRALRRDEVERGTRGLSDTTADEIREPHIAAVKDGADGIQPTPPAFMNAEDRPELLRGDSLKKHLVEILDAQGKRKKPVDRQTIRFRTNHHRSTSSKR
jgi:hypothetical protein